MNKTIRAWINILLGCFILASGFVFFINPYNIVPGGVYGASIVLHNLFPSIQVGTFGYMFDIPLLILSVVLLGSKLGVRTIAAALTTPLIMNLLTTLVYPTREALEALDPTQLLSADTWRQTLKTHRRKERPTLVAYLLREDPIQAWPHLENFARRMNARVEVFTQDFALPPPTSLATLRRRLQTSARILRPGPVRLRLSADPRAFVEAFDNARWVVSDSFHALMFASIFEKDVRFLRPTTPGRLQMFARIEEFAARHIHGPSIADTLPAALDALAHGPAVSHDTASLTAARAHSLTWLRTALT